jgi:hypothetical protein
MASNGQYCRTANAECDDNKPQQKNALLMAFTFRGHPLGHTTHDLGAVGA